MSKPNFWRLKRKAKDADTSSVNKPPKISQKTISSFFGAKDVPANLNSSKEQTDLDAAGCSKKAKLDENGAKVSTEKFRLSEKTVDKLRCFSNFIASDSSPSSHFKPNCERATLKQHKDYSSCDSNHTKESVENDEDILESEEESHTSNSSCLDNFKAKTQYNKGHQCMVVNQKHVVGKVKYTPLEQQVMQLWKLHPGILLFIECGYKYRFFGKDAEIAAQELNIYAYFDHNFMTASIPVHRLHAHINRLVEKGYKVGVVKQTETAALKANSDNKNTPFTRKLERIYTRATLIGEDLDPTGLQDIQIDEGLPAAHIFCLSEIPMEHKTYSIAFVAVNPSTGDCIYDVFLDQPTREELQKRLQIINPAEILTPPEVSVDTERLLSHIDSRLERLPAEVFDASSALTRVLAHFASEVEGQSESPQLEKLIDLPPLVLVCLAALQHHLVDFGLQRAIRSNGLHQLSSGTQFVYLDSSTLRNLEVFYSVTGTVHGSLFWALNHTKTKFGARLLQKWIAQPVRDLTLLEERQNSITELLHADGALVSQLSALLASLPDLERGITTILHCKCSPAQYLGVVETLCRLRTELSAVLVNLERDIEVPLLRKLVSDSIDLLADVQSYRDNINTQAAKDGEKTKLLWDFSSFSSVVHLMDQISKTLASLDELRPGIARRLSLLSVAYATVSGQEYLIEVRNTYSKNVPMNWRKISSTKQVGRYRPPEVDTLYSELQRLRERLRVECQVAWVELLRDFSRHYFNHKQAIYNVAVLDVLLSFAHIAQQEGYCKPKIIETEDAKVVIKRGRHPVIPLLFPSANQFVPNDTNLQSEGECCMVLSGPNMGGKSCYIRQVALITLLAHIGSYVPAEFAEISLLDSIHTRMGARDELFQGRSTLMVELDETAAILRRVSRRSLVLLDELGRGTGSCDGSAIACATLRHVVTEVKCITLFVTHYPSVMDTAAELKGCARNYHMAFLLHDQEDGEVLTFLYEVVSGAADRSYGINVARLANLDKKLLQRATEVAEKLEVQAQNRRKMRHMFVNMWKSVEA